MRTRQTQVPPLTLAEPTFVVLWEKLGFGDLPRPLFIPSPGRTEQERARIERDATLDLFQHGIGHSSGLDEGVVSMLALLARPAHEYYGWLVPGGGDTIGFTAATDGRATVLAKAAAGFVHLSPTGSSHLAHVLYAELGLRANAPGPARCLPRASPDLASLAEPVVRAQFFAAVRDRSSGRRRSSAAPVGYADTGRSSWLITPAADDRLTLSPAAPDTLAATLDQLTHSPFPPRESHPRVAPVPRSKD